MRTILLLLTVFVWCQVTKGKEAANISDVHSYELKGIKHEIQKRSITDIWESIKSSVNRTCEYIKDLAINTKKRLTDWIGKVKVKAQDIGRAFEERLKKIKDRFNKTIEKITETEEAVKKCLQEHKEEIDEILKNILFDVTSCISNSSSHLQNLAALQYGPVPNQTKLLTVIENDINKCVEKYKERDDVEECAHKIRKEIYKNMEITEGHILKNHTEARGATDDLLNTIVECTTEGLIKATTIIANETIHIIECVSNV